MNINLDDNSTHTCSYKYSSLVYWDEKAYYALNKLWRIVTEQELIVHFEEAIGLNTTFCLFVKTE